MPLHKKFRAGERVTINGTDIEFQRSAHLVFHSHADVAPRYPATDLPRQAEQALLVELERATPGPRLARLRKTSTWQEPSGDNVADHVANLMTALRFRTGVFEIGLPPNDRRIAFLLEWAEAVVRNPYKSDNAATLRACEIIASHSTDVILRGLATECAYQLTGELT